MKKSFTRQLKLLRHWILCCLSVTIWHIGYAQTNTVTGTVYSGAKIPLAGVSVAVKGSVNGTVTDEGGHFSINARQDDTLLFRSIGFQPIELVATGSDPMEVTLIPSAAGLNEVVVVGYGTQKKLDLTGAVQQIDGKKLVNRPVANVGQALEGVIGNLNVTTTGYPGGPGTNPSYNVRGTTSLNGGGPLFIVDGIPVDNISDINPNDVESISVLKDAAASAIYGARAAYGVIIVSTKKGKKNEPISVTYSDMFAASSYTRLPKMANSLEFAEAYNQASVNAGQTPAFNSTQLENLQKQIQHPGSVPTNVPDPNEPNKWNYASALSNDNIDWYRAYFKPWSFNQKHDLSLSGGGQSTSYYLSVGYYDEGGQLRYGNEVFRRYNVVSNVHSEPTKWLRLDLNTRYMNRKTDIPYDYAAIKGDWVHLASTRWPNWPLYNPDGKFSEVSSIGFMKDGGRRINGENDLSILGRAEAEPVKGWKIDVDYSFDNDYTRQQWQNAYIYATTIDGAKYNIGPSQNSVGEGTTSSTHKSFNLYSSYEKRWRKHYFKGLIGQQVEIYDHFDVSGIRADLITDDIPSLSIGTGTQNAYDAISDWATTGTFARLNYNYDEKFLLEVNGRYDGTSKFPPGHRFGLFPSVSAGYNMAKEKWWAPMEKYLDEFKIRASYGSLGNQDVANYLYLSTIGVGTNLGYIIGGVRPNFLGTPGLVSADLTWETARTFDVGLDAGMLDERLGLSFDWYVRNTLNMLGPAEALPVTLGTGVPVENNADLQTKGFELNISWQDQIGKDFHYNASFILSNYVARVTRYYNPTKILSTYYEGETIGDIWGYQTVGLINSEEQLSSMPDQSYLYNQWSQGDVLYKDLNGDNKINQGAYTLEDHGDLKVIGNSTPRFQYGFNLGATWKGFDISLFGQGVMHRDLWLGGSGGNSGGIFWGFTDGYGTNLYKTNLDYWTTDNTSAYWPKPYLSSEINKNHVVQTKYLKPGGYMRLKNFQIGYNLPAALLEKWKMHEIRIFVSGENMLTFSRINKNFDPEVVSGGYGAGKEYPLLKTMSLGLNVKF